MVFLEVDDRLLLLDPLLTTTILGLQLSHALRQWMHLLCLGTSLLHLHAGRADSRVRTSPGYQMRGVQTFPTQQRTDGSRLPAGCGLAHAEPVALVGECFFPLL